MTDLFLRWFYVIGIMEIVLFVLTLGNTRGGRDFWKTWLIFNFCAVVVIGIIYGFVWGLSGILGC